MPHAAQPPREVGGASPPGEGTRAGIEGDDIRDTPDSTPEKSLPGASTSDLGWVAVGWVAVSTSHVGSGAVGTVAVGAADASAPEPAARCGAPGVLDRYARGV